MDTDATERAQSGHYREMADELRGLIPKMKYAEVAEQLRRLAVSYERLAEHAERVPCEPQDIEGPLS